MTRNFPALRRNSVGQLFPPPFQVSPAPNVVFEYVIENQRIHCRLLISIIAKKRKNRIHSEYSFGGRYRDRTYDPLLVRQVLSRLS
jgi:hypothetical protein